jgi:hypothetical protein
VLNAVENADDVRDEDESELLVLELSH